MLLLLSPAKKLDFEESTGALPATEPALLAQAEVLAGLMKRMGVSDFKRLMKLSDKLAHLNVERYRNWTPDSTLQRSKQAILAFRGDVYIGMAATTFEQEQFQFAQDHLRILSGLYGVLRPLDLIQPHRLEMGTRLVNPRGANLYSYWSDWITPQLNLALQDAGGPVINLASAEYFRAVDSGQLDSEVITPQFYDEKEGQFKVISLYAKRARGMMCDYIIRNRLQKVQELQAFSAAGYRYCGEVLTPE